MRRANYTAKIAVGVDDDTDVLTTMELRLRLAITAAIETLGTPQPVGLPEVVVKWDDSEEIEEDEA